MTTASAVPVTRDEELEGDEALETPRGVGPRRFALDAIALLFERAPRRRQPEPSWLAFGAAAATILWLVFMGVLVVHLEATGGFGATYGPIAGTIGVLLWTFLSSVALFLGLHENVLEVA